MGIKRIVLKYHRDIAVLRLNIIYYIITNMNLPAGDFFQSGNQSQYGRLAAARWADKGDKSAVRDRKGYSVQDLHIAEGFMKFFDFNRRHIVLSLILSFRLQQCLQQNFFSAVQRPEPMVPSQRLKRRLVVRDQPCMHFENWRGQPRL